MPREIQQDIKVKMYEAFYSSERNTICPKQHVGQLSSLPIATSHLIDISLKSKFNFFLWDVI